MAEKGFVTEQDFREFTFTNAAMLHTRNNPGFFKGTVVEQAVADELGLESQDIKAGPEFWLWLTQRRAASFLWGRCNFPSNGDKRR